MFNFFKDMKQKIDSTLQSTPTQHVYRQYTHAELKIIAMRTRMLFQQLYKKQRQKITQKDSQFKKLQQNQSPLNEQYKVLQQIGKKVIQTQSIKLYIQFLRKIQSYSPQIITKKGDISLLKHEIKWFQCILWYRKCKNLTNIDQFNTFCYNFFKGVDVTQQLNVRCELFNVQYQELRYLKQDEIIPIQYLVHKIVPFVSFQIDQKQLQQIKVINKQQIKQKQEKQRQQKQKERRKIFKQGANNNSNNNIINNNNNNNSNSNIINNNIIPMPVMNPFDIINQRMTANNNNNNNLNSNSNQYTNNYNYNQPQQNQQFYNPNIINLNPNINPNINPNFNPNFNQYQNINNNNNNIQTSHIPFLPPPGQQKSIDNSNDEFAIDRFSRNYYNQQPIIKPTIVMPQQKVSSSQSQSLSKQKSFKSSQLNLINWQAMYGDNNKSNGNNKTQQQQSNPYINSSKIGLLNNNNFQQYISSSSNNEYDAYSLPYPPSGVIPMSEINYQPDHKFFVDTLDKYESQPVIGQYNDGMKKIKDGDDDQNESFIKGIEGEFFGGVANRSDNQNNNNNVQQLSEQQMLLKQIQDANNKNQLKQEQNITINESSTPKSFNRLFGHKLKSNLSQAQNQNISAQPTSQQKFPNLNLIQFIQSKLPIDNINSNDNDNNNDRNKQQQQQPQQQQQQSIIKKIQQDEIQQYLKQHHHYNNNNNNNNNNNIENNDNNNNNNNIDKQLDALHINNSSNYQSNDNSVEEHIDNDINKLINSHKQDIQHQRQSYRNEQNHNHNKEQNQLQQLRRFQQQQNHSHHTYYIDNQRIDSSTLQRHSQTQHAQSQYHHHHTQQYTTLSNDLIDSLNIIKRHFGQEFVTTANYCNHILQSQEVDNNNILQQQQQISPSKKGIKKPYMVSVYARQDYLNSVQGANHNT